MSDEQRILIESWREQVKRHPIKGCGRLDMGTYMPAPVQVGRVESDRVRYVYMQDGSECIVLGRLCDHVAFRAADYDALVERVAELESELALAKEIAQTRSPDDEEENLT